MFRGKDINRTFYITNQYQRIWTYKLYLTNISR
jgi:hypothetical protein